MIDLSKLKYKVVAVPNDGGQVDLTDMLISLDWEEGEKELSAHITLKVANEVNDNGERISDLVQPFTPVFVYAVLDGESEEVIRGTIAKWAITETNEMMILNLEAYDEVKALRKNQDEFYFTDGHSTASIISEVLGKWGVPYEYKGSEATHTKQVFRSKYLCDILVDVLKDAKEHGGDDCFIRAKEGTIQIIPRGTNSTVYCL